MRLHLRQDGQNRVEDAPKVHVHGVFKVTSLHILHRPDFNDPGVVDQNIYLAVMRGDFGDEPIDLNSVGQIADDRVDFVAFCRQLFPRLF